MTLNLPPEVLDQILIPERPKSADYLVENVRNHKGEPFNVLDFPWCKGICDAWDNPSVRQIALQFAARLGKTNIATSLIVGQIAHEPATWMYGNATEGLVIRTIRDKYYPMFENCPDTRPWLPPQKQRQQKEVVLSTCRGYSGWSGSPITLADLDPKWLHAGEIDKWSKNKSEEADPLQLFLQRGKEIPDRKVLIESTPAIEGRSRIEAALLSGWNCRFHCPCPRCGHYQMLDWGAGPDSKGNYTTGGIVFDKDENGRLNPAIAQKTARYLCEKCFKEWHDDEKRQVVQKGVWVPAGQWVTKTGKLRGAMQNPGPNASFQLSRLYAPTFTFGDVAHDFVVAELSSEEHMRDWRNSVMGWTWSPLLHIKPWEEVAELLCKSDEYELQTVPMGGHFLTLAVDVQDDSWVYKVVAWGQEQRGWVVDYGIVYSWDQVSSLLKRKYPHADGKGDIRISFTLIDAKDGNRKDEVIDFCRMHDTGMKKQKLQQAIRNATRVKRQKLQEQLRKLEATDIQFVWPYMGSSINLRSGSPYKHTPIDDANKKLTAKQATRKKHTLFGWITGNTNWFQQWINNCLFRRYPPSRMSLAYPRNAVDDRDLWQQMINESPSVSLDSTGHDRITWVVVRGDIPVDFRDCARMNRCAAEVYLRGNWARIPEKRLVVEVKKVNSSSPKPRQGLAKRVRKHHIRKMNKRF